MMNLRWTLPTALWMLISAQAAQAQAFDAQAGAIGGNGVAIIKHAPDRLRVHVQISATGKTLKEALARLEERREAAVEQLGELKAEEDSVVAGGPKPSVGSPQQQQMMEMVRRQRMRGKKTAKQPAQSATVSMTLTADWVLKGKQPQELLLEADSLQQKIKAADLAKVGEEELSPEEQELAEEMQEMVQEYGGGEQQRPGEPTFIFVKKITEDQLAAATAEAFGKAKAQAERLGAAAGVKLGPLRQISTQESAGADESYYNEYGGPSAMYRYYQQRRGQVDELQEAIGADASEVQIAVRVYAAFAVGE
jgi:uncharacterized protein YggE